jgi:hypothetical protein
MNKESEACRCHNILTGERGSNITRSKLEKQRDKNGD